MARIITHKLTVIAALSVVLLAAVAARVPSASARDLARGAMVDASGGISSRSQAASDISAGGTGSEALHAVTADSVSVPERRLGEVNGTEGRGLLPDDDPDCTRFHILTRVERIALQFPNFVFKVTITNNCPAGALVGPTLFGACAFQDFSGIGTLNPDSTPSRFQKGPVFYQVAPGTCRLAFNQGPNGNVQIYPRTSVTFYYINKNYLRICPREIQFSNGDKWSQGANGACPQPTWIDSCPSCRLTA